MTAQEVRRNILQVIDRIQGDSASYVSDAQIAEELKMTVEEVQGHLEILEQQGRIDYSPTFEGASAYLSPRHRQQLREELEEPKMDEPMQVMAFDLYDPSQVRTLTGMFALGGNIGWQTFGNAPGDQCEGVRVQFNLAARVHQREALRIVHERLGQNRVEWLERRGPISSCWAT